MKAVEPITLSMDVVARDGTILCLTVHRTDAGRVELDNLLEVAERRAGSLHPLAAYTVKGFLAAADDRGELTLHDQVPGLAIDRPMMVTAGDWLQWLAEALTDAPDGAPSVQVHNQSYESDPAMWIDGQPLALADETEEAKEGGGYDA
jgi:hypothetical protein